MSSSLSSLTFRHNFVGLFAKIFNTANLSQKNVAKFFLCCSVSLVLTACGGGGGGGDENPGASSTTISGTAATGAAISGQVFIYGSAGEHESFPIDASGHYEIDVSELVAPFIIIARPDSGGLWLYSYASKAGVVANVTPLTNLALYLAYGKIDFTTLISDLTAKSLTFTQADLDNAQAAIKSKFSAKIAELGLDPSFDFFSLVFNTNGAGLDGLLDFLTIIIDMAGTGEITINGTVYDFAPATGDGSDPAAGDGTDPTTGDGSDPAAGDGTDPATGDGSDPGSTTTDFGSLALTGTYPDALSQFTFTPDSFEMMSDGVSMKWTQGAEADGINMVVQVFSGAPIAFVYNNGVMTETAGNAIDPVSGISMNATSVKFSTVSSVSGLTTLSGTLTIGD